MSHEALCDSEHDWQNSKRGARAPASECIEYIGQIELRVFTSHWWIRNRHAPGRPRQSSRIGISALSFPMRRYLSSSLAPLMPCHGKMPCATLNLDLDDEEANAPWTGR